VFVTATKEFAMNPYRIFAIAIIFCLVMCSESLANGQGGRARVPPPVPLTVDTQGMTAAMITELRCLSLNVYYEARGTNYRNQLAVAWVVRNRQAMTGQSICQVIYSPGQFTWTTKGMRWPAERNSWALAQQLALLVLQDHVYDITQGATHFHEHRMRPSWVRRAQTTVRIGSHTFHRIAQIAEVR
jgi:spore germination cell wall hydrolase CwlJ-like protein